MSCYDSLLEGICDLLRKDRVYRSKAFEALEVLEQRPFLLVHFKSEEEVRIPFVEVYGQQPKIREALSRGKDFDGFRVAKNPR
ncbi:MAG: hypothetical protein USCGTAYLOR_01219 [Chromatiales bacterium USCg_Taylor]|nr:MAG: hypothetical protein USCGTAYLOR_01219 [Chromatiales bacterium USCg_Taylor]